jgi:hypothetical protein
VGGEQRTGVRHGEVLTWYAPPCLRRYSTTNEMDDAIGSLPDLTPGELDTLVRFPEADGAWALKLALLELVVGRHLRIVPGRRRTRWRTWQTETWVTAGPLGFRAVPPSQRSVWSNCVSARSLADCAYSCWDNDDELAPRRGLAAKGLLIEERYRWMRVIPRKRWRLTELGARTKPEAAARIRTARGQYAAWRGRTGQGPASSPLEMAGALLLILAHPHPMILRDLATVSGPASSTPAGSSRPDLEAVDPDAELLSPFAFSKAFWAIDAYVDESIRKWRSDDPS